MEGTKNVTVEDVLRISIDTLRKIQISMDEYERIGGPVSTTIHNLIECVNAIERANAERTQEPVQEDPGDNEADGDADA